MTPQQMNAVRHTDRKQLETLMPELWALRDLL